MKSREGDLSRLKDFEDKVPAKTITRVSVSPGSKEQICFLCAMEVIKNEYKRRLIGPGGRKNKVCLDCLDLEMLAGRQFTAAELTTNIICRNCDDKNVRMSGFCPLP